VIRRDLQSKLMDGLFTGFALIFLTAVLRLLMLFSEAVLGKPGVLSLVFGVLAVMILCLDRSLVSRFPDALRARFGMAGGILAWTLVELNSSLLEEGLRFSLPFVLELIVISLIVSVLWRRLLPLGGKFYALTFLLDWGNTLLLLVKQQLEAGYSPPIKAVWSIIGYLAILGIIVTIGWILTFSENRQQRLWGGLVLWVLASLVLGIFQRVYL
jgi:hypothetical protein